MKIETNSYRIADKLFLVEQVLKQDKSPLKPVETPTNHVAVIDCSGSMSYDLPKIREQLKKKLPKLLKEKDTFSLIWFSGRGEFGALLEAEPVATLKDLADVEKAIDRWLKPVGLTGFKEPIEEVEKLVGRVKKKHPNPFSLFFMSDGCDNQWERTSILQAVEKAAGHLASAAFVEYGYYADRPLLAAMAEKAGGQLLFAEAFDSYAPTFEGVISKRPTGAKRVEVKIEGDPIGGFAFAAHRGDLLTFDASSGTVVVPEGLQRLGYLSPTCVGTRGDDLAVLAEAAVGSPTSHAEEPVVAGYAALSLFAVRMKPDIVFPLLRALGDVSLIEQFANCFGKQKYTEFMETAKDAVFDWCLRWGHGFDPNRVPADDAFTVLDLLRILSDDEGNRVLLDHKDFQYSRISRGRVDSDPTSSLTFDPDSASAGYPISSLTYNEERPNISLLVKKSGAVSLAGRTDLPAGLPTTLPSFIYRNYAIIRDGLVNMEKLPVKLTQGTIETLQKAGFSFKGSPAVDDVTVLNLKALPILNRKMVKEVSAKELLTLELALTEHRAEQKVYNTYKKELFPRRSEGYAVVYGAEAAEWLKEQGLTDYSGFSPKQVQAESKDFYVGKELAVSLKGLSTLPSVREVKERLAKGKALSGCAAMMSPAIAEVENFLKGNPEKLHEKWLDGKFATAQAAVRGLIWKKAQALFVVVVGQTWFKEWKTLDENTMKIGGVEGKIEMREVEIKI